MGRDYELNLPSVVKRGRYCFNLIVRGGQQMEAAQNEMNWLAGRCLRSFDDLFNGWVATAYDEHYAIRRIQCERNFP